MWERLKEDVRTIKERDPAARNAVEIFLCYPGLHAVWLHRIAHFLYQRKWYTTDLRNQRFTCVDLATGKKKWTTQPYGQYWSLGAQGDRILALDQRGELLLIHATPERFDLLDSRKISEQETWGHLAVCGEQVFVRPRQKRVFSDVYEI